MPTTLDIINLTDGKWTFLVATFNVGSIYVGSIYVAPSRVLSATPDNINLTSRQTCGAVGAVAYVEEAHIGIGRAALQHAVGHGERDTRIDGAAVLHRAVRSPQGATAEAPCWGLQAWAGGVTHIRAAALQHAAGHGERAARGLDGSAVVDSAAVLAKRLVLLECWLSGLVAFEFPKVAPDAQRYLRHG